MSKYEQYKVEVERKNAEKNVIKFGNVVLMILNSHLKSAGNASIRLRADIN